MRHNPILSETDAFRVTVAVAALAVASAILGWLTVPLAGVAVFVTHVSMEGD
jgi:hypothetical protein